MGETMKPVRSRIEEIKKNYEKERDVGLARMQLGGLAGRLKIEIKRNERDFLEVKNTYHVLFNKKPKF